MPPDRPDASGIETDIELISSQDYNFGENVTMNDKEKENASVLTDSNSTNDCQSEIPKWEKVMEKNSQSDDELTSLSWLHQQNLLKGLDISNPSKNMKHENMLNNNICDDMADFSENTNSVSSLDDSFCPENNGKSNATLNGNGQNCQHPAKNYQKPTQIFQESAKSHYNISPSNQTKISLSNNNLPMSYRNKHPTHIPYDPHLHRNSKPPYSFSCLIFMAIEDSPVKALPVKEVYAWILEHFPYFRNAPTGWKNSVRHNLSLNKCFRKVEKAPNLGKGSLWMVDAQYRPNLIQALSRAPFPPPTTQNLSSSEKVPRKCINTRLPDPVLFPYLSKRLASSNINDSAETEIDSDVDAAAAAMLSFKHGPIILNHNKDRKRKLPDSEKLVPIITRSSSEDHTYSCIASIKLGSKHSNEEELNPDFDEQRKIAEGADALLNLAGVSTALNYTRTHHVTQGINTASKSDVILKPKKRSTTSEYSSTSEKRRKRWRDWGEENRYLKQIRG
ncbi:Forkhead box protein N3 [Trachymyrmex septentrionalis]|uniref:Forkhead box protein N3 n=1 Tax=Trachymyrmex septentrionalis TaxID=34720 RepID=A0A195FWT3_9HYME|nr:PREDICTED: forkhead box protein N3-like [Trachymyrmex septentrionalis]XP_018344610.1 PREDICTED: forkhead box protein N3-like [Trachymyrmex septentrionalis]XP_018344620.1 PREDICTED: forkhead box protein N3-like [Trachymyrmex septentrionalis]XP_018344627.1 PREDICTED: forkhead box protein N3-like [Trachymyrmex septentrionalis]XP_018344635.1 PREDICTED: forkhead box protein N3-like [Trachymyrmex septentrionalis]KYN44898.1 Forkhead box protein N3 [Trachymyrmex septentrionalis]